MIVLDNVEIRYGDFVAVTDINFQVNKGEFFTLLGPSGCGKTTTLRAIAGFNDPYQGTIHLDGQDITRVPVERRNLGMVFQSYALFPTMTVFDNIAYGLRVQKQSKSQIQARVQELADLVEISDDQLQRNVSELSGGQQQRVAIARALARGNDVILFDEPLSNLDAKLRKQLRAELKEIQRQTGMTAIYVTHDQEEALEMSDQIAVFNKGVIEQVGTPMEVFNQSATEFICRFVGESNALDDRIIAYINDQGPSRPLDPSKRHYLRYEKIRFYNLEADDRWLALPAVVKDIVFQGMLTRYRLDILGNDIYAVQTNDENRLYSLEEETTVYINPDHILEYAR